MATVAFTPLYRAGADGRQGQADAGVDRRGALMSALFGSRRGVECLQIQVNRRKICASFYAHKTMLTFENAPKKAVNLTLNSAVLALARELGMNVSQTVDAFLQAEVRRLHREKWRLENRASIAAYNERVRSGGAFGDDIRSF